jgi:hypothetical protein
VQTQVRSAQPSKRRVRMLVYWLVIL